MTDPEPTTSSKQSDRQPAFGESWFHRAKRSVLGGPKNLYDKAIYHQLTLISLLAWIGLGGDALSSSSYGPQESFSIIKNHPHLAVALAIASAGTVFLISSAYSKLIELFPNGGGYGVATRLLGPRVGMISGCALLIDYVLTIAVSITACTQAIFSFLPSAWFTPDSFGLTTTQLDAAISTSRHHWMLTADVVAIIMLIVLNLRGLKESIVILTPIFLVFVLSHILLIGGGFAFHIPEMVSTAQNVSTGFQQDFSAIGLMGMGLLLLNAYAMGGGTYTGIEAVSNALPLMREPRVQTAKRTMLYMAISLAVMAAGLLMCYLLWQIPAATGGKTMNAMLAEAIAPHFGGQWFVIVTLLSEGALLMVAAQTGFIGGPRVLANMAVDSWLPRRFASLSERLTTENGIVIMGIAALGMVFYAQGDIGVLVVIYAITVFLSFALTMLGMTLLWLRRRHADFPLRLRRVALFGGGLIVCTTILIFTCVHEFADGGWVALAVTGGLSAMCLLIRSHYHMVNAKVAKLYATLGNIPKATNQSPGEPDPKYPTAVVLVGGFGGLGIHTVLNVFRSFPNHFKNLVFVSVGVVDSGEFKGEDTAEALNQRTQDTLAKYIDMANGMGIPATSRYSVGTDAVEEATDLCLKVAKEFPKCTFFAGKIIFQRERWYQWLLHNDTAYAVQTRLHWEGKTMVVLPARIR